MKARTNNNRGATIDIRGASKFYGSFAALDNIDLRIENGEFMTFLGPSGSGKTTTLNLIAGFADLSAGDIALDDRSIKGLPAHKRNIGVVFQHYALFPHMSVYRNILYPLTMRRLPKSERDEKTRRAIELVKLDGFADRYPSELSGGQQQRVALARAIVFDPPLLLMDEPLGALDKKLREWLQLEIKRIHREIGSTFVYVTHDQEEALTLSDRIAVFNKGRIEQVGSGQELYNNPANLFVGFFIGESSVFRGALETRGGQTAINLCGNTIVCDGQPQDQSGYVGLVRPEKITMTAAKHGGDAAGANKVSGVVIESVYLGSGAKYEVRLPDGTIVYTRTSLASQMFAIGDEVELKWQIKDTKLLHDNTDVSPRDEI